MIGFSCPSCGHKFLVPPDCANEKRFCSECGERMVTPSVESDGYPPAEPAAAPAPRAVAPSACVSEREGAKGFYLECPGCRRRLFGELRLAGKTVHCPNCHRPVTVPTVPVGSPDGAVAVSGPTAEAPPNTLLILARFPQERMAGLEFIPRPGVQVTVPAEGQPWPSSTFEMFIWPSRRGRSSGGIERGRRVRWSLGLTQKQFPVGEGLAIQFNEDFDDWQLEAILLSKAGEQTRRRIVRVDSTGTVSDEVALVR